jgi:hypothetical protein
MWPDASAGCQELMVLTKLQVDLLKLLRAAVEDRPIRQVVYCTEWLGYLPFGLYHWIECGDHDVSKNLPSNWCLDWSGTDLEKLAEGGFLMKIDEWQNPDDACHTKITYKVPLA